MTDSPRTRVLIAHGDPLITAGLAITLQRQCDFKAHVCKPTTTLLGQAGSDLPSADVVLADYDSGMRLLTSAAGVRHRVIILTHNEREASICRALEQGVRGYLLLGCSLQDLFEGLRAVRAGGIALGPAVASRVAEWTKQRALTPREADILRQLMLGRSNKCIALELNIAVGTVKTHVKAILGKLDAASRTEAVAIAQRRGMLQEEREIPPPAASVERTGIRPGPNPFTRGHQHDARLE